MLIRCKPESYWYIRSLAKKRHVTMSKTLKTVIDAYEENNPLNEEQTKKGDDNDA
jgi:hypothetical protein